jgi:hypothetical protein
LKVSASAAADASVSGGRLAICTPEHMLRC